MKKSLFAISLFSLVVLLPGIMFASGGKDMDSGTADYMAASGIPPAEAETITWLEMSPRHGEWVTYEVAGEEVRAWIVYPERPDAAPVVIVIHEIYGLNDWARAVADKLAEDGYIAIAPDFLSGKGAGGGGSEIVGKDEARALISALDPAEITARIDGAVAYGLSLDAAADSFGIVGFCWGGAVSFRYATERSDLGAAVVYYGTSPATDSLAGIQAPVLGLYGGDDARVNATVPAAEAEMERLGKAYTVKTFEGAGHAFLRNQTDRNGANQLAADKAWPLTLEFLGDYLEP